MSLRSSRLLPLLSLLFVPALGACDATEPDAPPEPPDVELAPLAAAAYKGAIKRDTLTLTGTNADSRLTLRAQGTLLAVDIGDDGSADLTFDRTKFSKIIVDAAGGADVLRVDDSGGVFTLEERLTLRGGAGHDTLSGGYGPESLDGGDGHDQIFGGGGSDVLAGGAGDDLITWNPGNGSDVITGGAGHDRLVVHGASISENIGLVALDGRLALTRDVGAVTLDAVDVEEVVYDALGGSDVITVDDLSTTDVERVTVDLAAVGGVGDGLPDTVTLRGPAGGAIDVASDGTAVIASGAGADVAVTRGEPGLDRLVVATGGTVTVNGSDAADVIDVLSAGGPSPLVLPAGWSVGVGTAGVGAIVVRGLGGDDELRASTVSTAYALTLDGGDGDDHIRGSAIPDVIRGGAGADTIDGGYASDTIAAGDGDDLILWNPGSGSDVIEGELGEDALVFSGANIGERLDIGGVAGRLRFLRDVATVTIDAGTIERVEVHALGGADIITLHDLAATTVRRVDVDLAAAGGIPDGLTDQVIVRAPSEAMTIEAEGDAIVARGGAGADVFVRGGELALDTLVASQVDALVALGSEGADTIDVADDAGHPRVAMIGWNVAASCDVVGALVIDARGGHDFARSFSSVGVHLEGGDGDDTLYGGAGPDVLVGGPGADVIDGGYAGDVISLGDGDDTVVWNPGGASDTIDGDLGADRLVMNGSSIGEILELATSGARARLTRNVGTVALDLGGIESVDLNAGNGNDNVIVNDLAGTPITQVVVNLAATISGGGADGLVDVVTVRGSEGPDAIYTFAEGTHVVTSGLAATVRVFGQDPMDALDVHGMGGLDSLTADPIVQWFIFLVLNQD